MTCPFTCTHIEALIAGQPRVDEYRIITKSGEVRWVRQFGRPVWDETEGQVVRIVGATQDITEHKQAEAALAEQRRFLRQLIDLIPSAVFVKDGEGRYLLANTAQAELYGMASDDLLGKTDGDICHGQAEAEAFRKADRLVMESLTPQLVAEEPLTLASGETRWFQTAKVPLVDDDGRCQRVLGLATDITERKQAKKALRASEQRLRILFDSVRDLISLTDEAAVTLWANPAWQRVFGTQLERRNAFALNHPDDVERVNEAWRALVVDGVELWDLEHRYRLPSGEYATFETSVHAVMLGDQRRYFVIGHDVTERKRAEEALRDSRRMLQTVLESIPAAVFWKDRDLLYLGGNRTWLKAAGLKSSEEVVGKSDYDLPWERKQADSFREHDTMVMESGVPEYDIIEPYRQADGTHTWARTNKVPLRDTEGNVVGVLGTYEDITERRRAEEALKEYAERLEQMVEQRTVELSQRVAQVEQLNQALANMLADLEAAHRASQQTAQRLQAANAELEAFAYSVSHDLRAPLRAINGFAQIIARRHRDRLPEEGQHYFDNIIKASAHMGVLIDDLLRYSRLGRSGVRRQPVPLGDALAWASEALAGRVAETNAQLTIPDDLPVVRGDPTLLGQVFTNLLDNALTYHRPGVPPQIVVGYKAEANHVVISVTDNGIGIAPEFHAKIFQVFQRLHPQDQYPGTGIGLAIVQKAVALLDGRVWLESALGQGSTFYVQLPVGGEQ